MYLKLTSAIRRITPDALYAGIRAFLFSFAVLYFTYYLATWLFWKAPKTDITKSLIFWWPLILMWIPGVLAMLFRVITREGFFDVGWKAGKLTYWILAITVPFLMATMTYLVGYLTGIVSIDAKSLHGAMFIDQYGILPAAWPAFTPDSLFMRLLIKLGVEATFGLLPEFIFAIGEELGWRGYLQLRLIQSRLPFPLILCGLVWSLWHFPWMMYQNPLEIVLFILLVILLGIWIGWLRIKSGSVWVAAMAHAAHNGFLLTLYSNSFHINKSFWVSEAGIFPILAYAIILAFLILREKQKRAAIRGIFYPAAID
jgi:uncharacterized protein